MGLGGTAGADRPSGHKGTISMVEVAKHNKVDDAWLVYRNKVYDVSNWHNHPGGRLIFTHAGRDATDTFNSFHPASAHTVLRDFCIGDLAQDDYHVTPFERDYQTLRAKIKKAGLHKASTLYYIFKVLSSVALWAIGAAFIVYSQSSWSPWLSVFAGSFFIALFWQQDGWLAHDFLHHQVFANRYYGDLAGIIIGNVWQGFSVEWWKDKHNTHHAIPNMHETTDGAHDGDPDIDTMPMLAWSRQMAVKAKDAGAIGRFFVKHQAVLYFPILLVARLSWLMQSFFFVFRMESSWNQKMEQKPLSLGRLEHVGLILYYVWYLGLMLFLTPLQAVTFLFASQMMCGLMLALAFGLGHNGMAVYDADSTPEFGEWQITTTRNVEGSWLVGWFMGGLHFQVEHHLFPDVPRHNLHKLRAMVEPLCEKHGIPYHATSMAVGTVEVLKHLDDVTEHLMQEFPGL